MTIRDVDGYHRPSPGIQPEKVISLTVFDQLQDLALKMALERLRVQLEIVSLQKRVTIVVDDEGKEKSENTKIMVEHLTGYLKELDSVVLSLDEKIEIAKCA